MNVEDALSDSLIQSQIDPRFSSALADAYSRAKAEHGHIDLQREGYTVRVDKHGDISVRIDGRGGFDNLTSEGGEEFAALAGPAVDPFSLEGRLFNRR